MTEVSENKRIAKNTIYLYMRMFVSLVVGLYTSRVTLAALGISDYGIYNVVGGIVTMFVFINYAMVNSTQRYITYEIGKGNWERLNKVFSTSINIHVLIALIIFVLSETIGLWFLYHKMVIPEERMNAALWIYQFSILTCMFNVLSAPYNALIIAHEKMNVFAYISLLEVGMKLAIVLLVSLYCRDRLILFGALLMAAAIVVRFIYSIYCHRHYIESKYKLGWDKSLTLEMMKFASWNLMGNFAYVTYTQGLNIILNLFFSPVVNAARGVAVQVQTTIASFSYNIETAIKPQITKSYAQEDKQRLLTLMYASARLSFFALLLLSMPVFFEIDQLLNLWLVEVPQHSVNFVRLTILILLADSLTGPLLTAVQATGDVKRYQLTVSLLCLLILPCAYFSLIYFPIPELVFVVNLIIVLITQLVKLVVVCGKIRVSKRDYVKNVFFRAGVVLICSSIVVTPLRLFIDESIMRLFLVCLACVLTTLASIYLIGISSKERMAVNLKVADYLKRRKHKTIR